MEIHSPSLKKLEQNNLDISVFENSLLALNHQQIIIENKISDISKMIDQRQCEIQEKKQKILSGFKQWLDQINLKKRTIEEIIRNETIENDSLNNKIASIEIQISEKKESILKPINFIRTIQEKSHLKKDIVELNKIENEIGKKLVKHKKELKKIEEIIQILSLKYENSDFDLSLSSKKEYETAFSDVVRPSIKELKNEIDDFSRLEKIILQLGTDLKNQESELGEIKNRTRHHEKETKKLKENNIFILNQRDKGLELYEEEWRSIEEIKKLKEIKIGLTTNFKNINPFDFEHFVAALMNEMGYETNVTQKSSDYGIDIIARKNSKKIAVQCKRHSEDNKIGNKLIQQLLGSMDFVKADSCIFVTTSYFTSNALKQGINSPIELWDKDTFHNLVKKHLLNLDIDEVFDAIEKEKKKKQDLQLALKKLEEEKKRKLEDAKILKKAKLDEKKRKDEEKKKTQRLKLEEKRQAKEIKNEERKKRIEEQRELKKNRSYEKKINAHEKTICPRCGGGKLKTRTICSACKRELQAERKRSNYYYENDNSFDVWY